MGKMQLLSRNNTVVKNPSSTRHRFENHPCSLEGLWRCVYQDGTFGVSSGFSVMPTIEFHSVAVEHQVLYFHLNCLKMGIEGGSDFGFYSNSGIWMCAYWQVLTSLCVLCRLWETGWKQRYYKNKFDVDASDEKFRRKVVQSYVEGLCWVLRYYYQVPTNCFSESSRCCCVCSLFLFRKQSLPIARVWKAELFLRL